MGLERQATEYEEASISCGSFVKRLTTLLPAVHGIPLRSRASNKGPREADLNFMI